MAFLASDGSAKRFSVELKAALVPNHSRRSLLISPAILLLTPSVVNAAMDNSQKVFVQGKTLTTDEARDRFVEARKSMQYLLENFDEICKGGGDNVRRYLGTVGTSSGMFGVVKVMKILSQEADDLVEFTEAANEVEQCVQQADGSSYMAIFVTTSSSGTPPEKYFSDALVEIKRCIKAMDEVARQIDLKF